jgi:hypothetical protein
MIICGDDPYSQQPQQQGKMQETNSRKDAMKDARATRDYIHTSVGIYTYIYIKMQSNDDRPMANPFHP